eukprot:CAMPEP_0168233864 /NCGR_PEP_ID=MMETSP0140_2-20121125/17949_1 /TAXON_ID=44445 /ORGANISM="Pseudo-nitzschia australis, Strain 10249 10 AB" /LENGTH=183 /DNA_ID=CAMNT_0008166597 /DNA_START=687 /DNA_END=1235 /DNA_ORIENTATION=-
MVDYDSKYIHAVPIKSRKAEDLVEGFRACYSNLTTNGLAGTYVRLDNEASRLLIQHIKSNNMEYQLASPGDHHINYAERAIQQTYKNHFISTLQGTDPGFPANGWDLLLPQLNITLNLLRASQVNPKLSAYAQVHGPFDFNKTPLAPLGCKIVIHDRAEEQRSWVGPALHHYRNYQCYIPSTK